jgi:uncharacterized protein (TIGR02246 family)
MIGNQRRVNFGGKHMKIVLRALLIALASLCSVLSAAEPENVTDAIRQRVEAYVAAYNQHDAQALADLWADDAVYLNRDTGEPIEGRAAIREMFASIFDSGEASQLSVTIQSVRSVTDDVVIEDGTADLVSVDGETISSTYTAIHVKKDGVWYLNSVRETDMPSPPPQEHGALDELAWLIGDWVDESPDATVLTSWQWTKNEHFLTSHFSVSVEGRVEIEGTQVIGWDPVAGQIRSWVFDSEGGFGEGLWRRVGNDWIVDTTSTLSDGSQGSATNIYTPIDEDTFTWKSVDRQIDGEPQEDIDEIPVHRQVAVASNDVMTEQQINGGN